MITIYRASAGSGKTYTLAYQYIKMLLGRQLEAAGDYRLARGRRLRHRSILAITFTNKATDEMKQRILHELAVLAGTEEGGSRTSPYLADLCRDLHADAEDIASEARRALTEILFDYGLFSVSTIDSFFQEVLRTFAREADLTGNYEVELDEMGMIAMAVAGLFRAMEYGDDRRAAARTKGWLTAFLRQQIRMGESTDIFNRRSGLFGKLCLFVSNALNEDFTAAGDAITDYLADETKLADFARALTARLESAEQRLRRAAQAAMAMTPRLAESLNKTNIGLISNLQMWKKDEELKPTVIKLADDPSIIFRNLKDYPELLEETEFLDSIASTAALAIEYFTTKKTLGPIRKNIHFLGLLADILREMEGIRRENNTLLLSDTNAILAKIVKDDDTPFLYERMGVWLEHFLIDEFQDTSRMQWECLKPLLSEGAATDRDSLIIGDEKQCIYRFRSSDPTLLGRGVRERFPDPRCDDNAGGNTNWRSSRTIVEFNNAFFRKAAEALRQGDVYSNVEQAISPAHDSHLGYVDIQPAGGSAAAAANVGYERMAENIARQINEGGYKPSDIAVLARNKSAAVDAITYLIRRQEEDPSFPRFRIISDESIQIGQSKSVKLIISVLRSIFLSRPDDESLEVVEERRRRNHNLSTDILARFINDYEFFSLTDTPEVALAKAVKASRTGRDADSGPDVVAHAPMVDTEMVCPNLQTLLDRIIRAMISPAEYQEDHIFISALQDEMANFTSKYGADLRGFLDWWDEKGRMKSVGAPQADDTLRVMTIHKSKGLEFKCVHIPVANWRVVRFKSTEWFAAPESLPGVDPAVIPPIIPMLPGSDMVGTVFEPEYNKRVNELILDELNVMYVAFTRAVDELIITYGGRSDKTNSRGLMLEPTLKALGSMNGALTIGEPTHAPEEKRKSRTALEPDILMVLPARMPDERPTVWSKTRLDMTFDPLTPRGRGIMLHDVLSQIHEAGDLDRAVRRMAGRGIVPREMMGDVRAILAKELERPEVKQWFDGFQRVLTERPIAIGPEGADHRRPDRVVWTADGHVDVIDYKSGEERPEAHRRQVAFYMKQLRQLGCRRVRGYIWYLDSGEIVAVRPVSPAARESATDKT